MLRGARGESAAHGTIGFDVYRFQLVAYVIAGALGGLAGFLLANLTEFVSPAYMSWQRSGELIIMVILGGVGTLDGAILGAAAFLLAEEWLSGITEHWKVIFGPLLVLVVLFARGGLIGLAAGLAGCCAVADPVLRIEGLRKNFGGLAVTDDVTLDVHAGRAARRDRAERRRQDHADQPDIRPRSAPDAGRIVFAGDGRDRACRCTRARARACAHVPDHLDPAAAFRCWRTSRWPCRRATARASASSAAPPPRRRSTTPAMAALAQVGLARTRRRRRPANLSHGEKRALELAIALAMEPKLLLLDEPMAGIGRDETERLVAVLRSPQGPLTDGAGRARHGRRCSRSPTASRC